MRGQTSEPLKKLITALIVLVVVLLGAYLAKSFYVDGPGGSFQLLPTQYGGSALSQEGFVRYRVSTGAIEYWGNGWEKLSGTRTVGTHVLNEGEIRSLIEGRYFVASAVTFPLTQGYTLFFDGRVPRSDNEKPSSDWGGLIAQPLLSWKRGDFIAFILDSSKQQVGAYRLPLASSSAEYLSFDKPLPVDEDGWKALATTALREHRRSLLVAPLSYGDVLYCGTYYTSQGGLDIVFDLTKPVAEGTVCTVKG